MTGEASETDPLVEFHGHKSADSDTTYWVDPVTCVRRNCCPGARR